MRTKRTHLMQLRETVLLRDSLLRSAIPSQPDSDPIDGDSCGTASTWDGDVVDEATFGTLFVAEFGDGGVGAGVFAGAGQGVLVVGCGGGEGGCGEEGG